MQHVLITGASRGIGLACAKKFTDNGYLVSALARHRDEFAETEGQSRFIECDVSSYESSLAAADKAVKEFGKIDVLISCAGISVTGLSQDMTNEDYHNVMDINFGGYFNMCRCVIPSMVSAQKGVIIAVSSMWGQTGASCEALYSASKGAVDAYTKSLAKELAPSGIGVNAVSPGVIKTDMLKEYTENDLSVLSEETPLGRLGKPEDVANAVFMLASEDSSFITGQILGINGGYLI